MQSYLKFKEATKTNSYIPNYYQLLFKFREDIVKDIETTTQYQVAQSLNLQPIKLSHIMQVLSKIPKCSCESNNKGNKHD